MRHPLRWSCSLLFLARSKIVTSIRGHRSFRFMARKNPAAPPPIIAVFISVVLLSLLTKLTTSSVKSKQSLNNYVF